jgi:CPA2 family monovalent cation:H+ antiporter-2
MLVVGCALLSLAHHPDRAHQIARAAFAWHLSLALGVAWAAYFWFDASFALGAFLGGLALNGTKFSHKVAEDSLPLRDTFAVLFFVAVGMLFDPGVLLRQPWMVAAIVAVVIFGKAALRTC